MTSPKRLTRIAGLLYLIVGLFGACVIAYVSARVYIPGDAAATAQNVRANAGLVRVGAIADLLQATVFVFLAMVLYEPIFHVNKNLARAMAIVVAIATALLCFNAIFQFAALLVATAGLYMGAFGAAGSNALVLLLLDMHYDGFLIAQIFFGLWLAPLVYFAYVSSIARLPGRRFVQHMSH
ncbi:MAG TPA: DUF4386 domain-containing protein [Roseiflexaceae bacterium]|nr:DUF4386 domain-containing protein [Roseiflexaceae bacterium]